MKRSAADVIREYGPYEGVDQVGGVTYDGERIWFAAGDTLKSIDPESGAASRSLEVAAHAGTAFDGKHLFQIAENQIRKIDPSTGRVLATTPAPSTGAVLRTIESNRFVTGVSWVDGELWHATWEEDRSDLRRIDPETGAVLETLDMPAGIGVSGLESDGGERFFCGGGRSAKIRVVRRPKRSSKSR
ncbi:MAG TPA: hypothetical protein VHV81_12185 [Steroidobacteraceae bacterium]|nr:hypothetical protein [Steroidobacteraceae bacterium]